MQLLEHNLYLSYLPIYKAHLDSALKTYLDLKNSKVVPNYLTVRTQNIQTWEFNYNPGNAALLDLLFDLTLGVAVTVISAVVGVGVGGVIGAVVSLFEFLIDILLLWSTLSFWQELDALTCVNLYLDYAYHVGNGYYIDLGWFGKYLTGVGYFSTIYMDAYRCTSSGAIGNSIGRIQLQSFGLFSVGGGTLGVQAGYFAYSNWARA